VYSILDGMLLAGGLPPNKHKLVVAWIEIHQEDLLAELRRDGKLLTKQPHKQLPAKKYLDAGCLAARGGA
jgi:hypothetical protein